MIKMGGKVLIMETNENQNMTQNSKNNIVPIIIAAVGVVLIIVVLVVFMSMNNNSKKQASIAAGYSKVTDFNRTLEDLKDDAEEKGVYTQVKDEYRECEDLIDQLRTTIDAGNTDSVDSQEKTIQDKLDDLEDAINDEGKAAENNVSNAAEICDSYEDRLDTITETAKSKKVASQSKVKNAKESAEDALEKLSDAVDNKQTSRLETLKQTAKTKLDAYEAVVKKAKKKQTQNSSSVAGGSFLPGSTVSSMGLFANSWCELIPDNWENTDLYDYQKLALAILSKNEIYARHGVHFVTESLQQFFNNNYTWYVDKGVDSTKVSLNATERKNVDTLQKLINYYVSVTGYSGKASDFSYEEYMAILNDVAAQ